LGDFFFDLLDVFLFAAITYSFLRYTYFTQNPLKKEQKSPLLRGGLNV